MARETAYYPALIKPWVLAGSRSALLLRIGSPRLRARPPLRPYGPARVALDNRTHRRIARSRAWNWRAWRRVWGSPRSRSRRPTAACRCVPHTRRRSPRRSRATRLRRCQRNGRRSEVRAACERSVDGEDRFGNIGGSHRARRTRAPRAIAVGLAQPRAASADHPRLRGGRGQHVDRKSPRRFEPDDLPLARSGSRRD